MYKLRILFTLCGRAGSKGCKSKNLRKFLGIPLVYYGIAAIAEVMKELKDDMVDVVINSDSTELVQTAKNQELIPIEVLHREDELAGDIVSKVAVIQDCLRKMEAKGNCQYDMVVDLDLTSPLRTIENVMEAIRKKKERAETRVVYSVTESRRNPYFNMVKKVDDYYTRAIESTYTARQQIPALYDINGSIYVYSAEALRNEDSVTFFNGLCDVVFMKDTGILDIDSEGDYELLQVIGKYFFEHYEAYGKLYEVARKV